MSLEMVIYFPLCHLKALDARIIIGEFSNIGARNVFCEVGIIPFESFSKFLIV